MIKYSMNFPSDEAHINTEIQNICDSVIGRAIITYLPRGTMLNGRVLENAKEEFGNPGDGLETNPSTWNTESESAALFLRFCRRVKEDSKIGNMDAIAITFWDELDPDKKDLVILAMGGTQRPPETESRGNIPYNLFAELPRAEAIHLIEIVKGNPELAETFYQTVFKDLDSKPDIDTGLRRIKTYNLLIVNMNKVKEIILRTDDNHMSFRSTLDEIFSASVLLKFPDKFGVRD